MARSRLADVELGAWLQGVQFLGRQEVSLVMIPYSDLSALKQVCEAGKVELVTR